MSRSSQENKEILKQFSDWLAQTTEEIDKLDSSATDESSVEESVQQATVNVVIGDDAPENFSAKATVAFSVRAVASKPP